MRQGILHAMKHSPQIVGFWDADLATPLESIPVMRDVFRRHPDVTIFTPVVDRSLNEQKYIVPGLGDFGDRLYGTP